MSLVLYQSVVISCPACINRVYAKTKKKKTLEESEILPICSKKRVCEKIVLEEFSKFKYCKFNLKLFHDST